MAVGQAARPIVRIPASLPTSIPMRGPAETTAGITTEGQPARPSSERLRASGELYRSRPQAHRSRIKQKGHPEVAQVCADAGEQPQEDQ